MNAADQINFAPVEFADPLHSEETLVDLLDKVIDVGVVAKGELTISVADVDLLFVGLKVLICSPDKLPQMSPNQEVAA
ncbi:MAG: gas vesicle protein [Pseudomonadota bacterium]